MKKLYKNIYVTLLLITPYVLIGMKGPRNKENLNKNTNINGSKIRQDGPNINGFEIRQNQHENGSIENQYYDNNVLQFSLTKDSRGFTKLNYETANKQYVEFILTPLMETHERQPRFIETDPAIYQVDDQGGSSNRINTQTYWDKNNLRSYSTTTYPGSSRIEKFYDANIIGLDRTLLRDSSKSMKDFGIKMEKQTNANQSIIENLYFHNPEFDVIKFYNPSGAILFELDIDINNDYTAYLTIINANKQLETSFYKIESMFGVTSDFYKHKGLSHQEIVNRLPISF